MTLPSALDGLPEIRGALTADADGRVREATLPETASGDAAGTSAALREIAAAGAALGLAGLELLLVKGASAAVVAAVRSDGFLRVAVDPARGTAQVEKALQAWASDPDPAPVPAAAPAAPPESPQPSQPAPAPSAANGAAWAGLRRALLRGLLTEAATRRGELEGAMVSGRAGAEPLEPAELDAAMQALLQGIGSVLAGDGLGGMRTLEPLTGTAQRNLSFRWLALYWSGRAAVRSGSSVGARAHLTQALAVAKQLDLAAVAASQWIAAEVLTHEGDHARAQACLSAARGGFERLGDSWGLGRTWLAEARVLAELGREDEAIAAARQAWATDQVWDEPVVFLARRALVRNDAGEAEGLLRCIVGPSAERLRGIIEAIRAQVVSHADASEFLREAEAPPTARSIRAMERIAQAAPRFVQAREALAWMLLKAGKYAEAGTLFRGLLSQQLSEPDRASVMLGLGCIAHAQQGGKDPGVRMQAAVMAGTVPPRGATAAAEVAPLPLSATSIPARSSQLAGGAVFSGQLSVFALPDVMEFVRSARRTGVLVCSSERGMAAVQFREGRITGATSAAVPELGELLVEGRRMSPVALRAIRKAHPVAPPADGALAAELVREGIVDEAAVSEALRRKVELTILEVLRWEDGEFAFNREGNGEGEGKGKAAQVELELDAQDVLLNALKQIDEDARARSAPGTQQ